MNCFKHERVAAVGSCTVCQKGVCRECVARESPRLVCRACIDRGAIFGFEYRSAATIGGWPLIHVCNGLDPATMRPKIAKGVIAVGNIAIGGVAIGGLACGLLSIGGLSLGIGLALGGAALGLGVSVGGFAVGSVAIGGFAIGYSYAFGGGAIAPAIIDGQQCDAVARDFFTRWLGSSFLPPQCQ